MTRALFIGRSVLDIVSLVREFPGADGKAKAVINDLMPGGSSLNASIVFSHLGGEATLATSIGSPNLISNFVETDIRKYSVNLEDVCEDVNYKIPLSTVISSSDLGTRMIINGFQDDCKNLKDMTSIFANDYKLIQLDQYERPFVEMNYDNIRAFEGQVILDGGSWKNWSLDFLHLADIPIVSETFLKDGFKAFAEMCDNFGISRWAVTCGSNGVIWKDNEKTGQLPAISINAVDTLGAGDIFHGAFCYAFAKTYKFVEALSFANEIAAKSCESFGTRSWIDV